MGGKDGGQLKGSGGGHGQVEVLGAAVEVQHAIDIVEFTGALQQAVAQATGLEKLLPPLKPHATHGEQGAAGRIKFNPIRLQAAAGDGCGDVACADVTLQLGVVVLLVAGQLQLQGNRLGGARIDQGRRGLPLGCANGVGGWGWGLGRCWSRGSLHGDGGHRWCGRRGGLREGGSGVAGGGGSSVRLGCPRGRQLGKGDRWPQNGVGCRSLCRRVGGLARLLVRAQGSPQQDENHSLG
jgi:hypothetical protein